MNDGFPHLVAVRDVGVDHVLAEDQKQMSKLRAFDDANRLKMCESAKEQVIVGTYLVIRNDKADEIL
jgi:hypothetical protein